MMGKIQGIFWAKEINNLLSISWDISILNSGILANKDGRTGRATKLEQSIWEGNIRGEHAIKHVRHIAPFSQ